MADNSDVIAATLLAGTTAVSVFTSLLPHLSDVRKGEDIDTVRDTRLGEGAASAVVIAVGIIATQMTKSYLPLLVAMCAAATLVCMYESVLHM